MSAVLRCLKKHGFWYTVRKILIKVMYLLFPGQFVTLNRILLGNVMAGYMLYARMIKEYGKDVKILSCAFYGTGDYYILGMYLRMWLEKYHVRNWVFLTPGGSEQKVTELFPIYKKHTKIIVPSKFNNLRVLNCFVNVTNENIIHFHHQLPHPFNICWNVTNNNIIGYHDLNMVDFYLYWGLKLSASENKDLPVFEQSAYKVSQLFTKNHLTEGKTVLLSPYSTGLKEYQIPMWFWEYIASECTKIGYTACTNCSGKEKPIKNTIPIFIPYIEVVPFLDRAGVFIGIRSGLCDIIATSTCKKIIIHIYKGQFWPDGNSIAYTGLNNMGVCDDALEIEFNRNNRDTLIDEMVSHINNI